ncbi:MAG: TlpA family protein disulfide reductase, partial [Bacteroidota bacterium]
MRTLILSLFAICSFTFVSAQFPSVTIQDIDGKNINSNTLSEHDGPIVVSFWALWCKPCIQELMAINDAYIDLEEDYNLKLYAVSIDDARNATKVKSFVNGKAWDFEVLLDQNSDFKRAMNVNNVPHSLLLTPDGRIVKQHTSYVPGDEEILYEEIAKLYEDLQNDKGETQGSSDAQKRQTRPDAEQLRMKRDKRGDR